MEEVLARQYCLINVLKPLPVLYSNFTDVGSLIEIPGQDEEQEEREREEIEGRKEKTGEKIRREGKAR